MAATAVIDREKGLAEFARFTKYFKLFYNVKNRVWLPFIRPKVDLNERMVLAMGTSTADRMNEMVDRLAAAGRLKIPLVPGFGRYNYH